ncbi:ABC transporter ATP-binding protein [Fictibacillus sp. 18YEL24]|uniref:ABC transporter ATP-binding protein n=1 Tax=Fictibacillus sp. 18YEL24 TaxID=2745875 RepID=UPI0018CCA1F7|nr:ABC transporter ATP-binding protein [Fictibacillus sp. 18YEL24]MBH0169278.1 ABC transporter ATP-binding protein [Fictibacillus sp. 18YEL24]
MSRVAIIKAFKLIFTHGKSWIILSLISRITIGLMPFVVLKLTETLINHVTAFISNQTTSLRFIFLLLFAQFILTILKSILQHLNEVWDMEIEYKLDFVMGKMLSEKTTSISYKYFESTEFFNTLERIGNNQGSRVISPLRHILDLFQAIISFCSYVVFLSMVHWSLVLLSVFVAIPTLLIQTKFGNEKFFLMKYLTKEAREANFISGLFQDKGGNKEIRLFNLSSYLLKKWERLTHYTNNKAIHLMKREKRTHILLDGLTALLYGGGSWIIIHLLRSNKLGIGEFVSIGQAIQGAQGVINSAAVSIARIYEEQLYLNDYFTFIEAEEEISTESHPIWIDASSAITLNHVSFSYSDTSPNVLNEINLTIKKGEKIAIVGENGSGKTTLIKCILGLYPISSGDIYINQKHIQSMERNEISKSISVIFQDFMSYPFSVRENIAFGDLKEIKNDDLLLELCKYSGLLNKINSLPEGLDTNLGKILSNESEELSGGQWQRIAIARALLKNAEILILDEPTSSLDPLTEMEIFERMNEMANDRTAIFVSHRMAAARFADRIIVMKNGSIVEVGSHSELMSSETLYSELFKVQAKWYA